MKKKQTTNKYRIKDFKSKKTRQNHLLQKLEFRILF